MAFATNWPIRDPIVSVLKLLEGPYHMSANKHISMCNIILHVTYEVAGCFDVLNSTCPLFAISYLDHGIYDNFGMMLPGLCI